MSLWTERGEIVMRNGQLRHDGGWIVGVNSTLLARPIASAVTVHGCHPRLPAP